MRTTRLLTAAGLSIVLPASAVLAAREPLRSFVPLRGLVDAQIDAPYRFGPPIPPIPPMEQQLRPLPSFATPPGFRGVHNSIWQRSRHYRWSQQQRATPMVYRRPETSGPKVIHVVKRAPAETISGGVIASIRVLSAGERPTR